MSGTINFNRDFAEWGGNVRDFEKANDVGYVYTELLSFNGAPYYPVGSLMSAQISSVWLGDGEPQNEDTLDLILRMLPVEHDAPDDYFFYEIVMRGQSAPFHAGFVDGTNLRVLDEVVNGHRVLETDFEGNVWRFVFVPGVGNGAGQYRFQQIVGAGQTSALRRRGKRSPR